MLPNHRKQTTDENLFKKDYAANAIMQKGFNEQIIVDLVQYILRKYPQAKTNPISILDLCCGDGGSTLALLEQLRLHGIIVKKLVGLDISPAQIEIAKRYTTDTVSFEVRDISKIDYTNEFDVVISLFGLHWISDLSALANKISQATKPGGLTMFFVPLEKNAFFATRQALMSSPKWKMIFKEFTIHPFFDSSLPYANAFNNFFTPENPEGINGDQPVIFTKDRLVRFLSSWMQEVRYLQDKSLADEYLKELMQLCAQSHRTEVECKQEGIEFFYVFNERIFWYHGAKPGEEKQYPAQITADQERITSKL